MNNQYIYIGKNGREVNEIFRQFGLIPLRKFLTSDDFDRIANETSEVKRRKRVFTSEVVFWLMGMVGIFCDSMGAALRKSWEQVRPLSKDMPRLPASQSAFTRARKRLPVDYFKKISDLVLNYFRKVYPLVECWKGFRVKIIDGMTITLPESNELRKYFGSRKNQNSRSSAPVQAHFIGLFWALVGICEGFAIGSLKLGEKTGLLKLIRLLKEGDLLLGDRGFPGYELYYAVLKTGAQFLFRLKRDVKPCRRKKLGQQDWLVVFKKPKNCKDKDLPEEIQLRLVALQTPGFRTMYLLTSLVDGEKYPRAELIKLYAERWQIETRYNELKHLLEIENLRSQDKVGIVKEILVRITLGNLVRLVILEAAQLEGVNVTDLSYQHALEKITDTILKMMHSLVYHWPFIYREMIEEIRQMKILKRPGRHYPRHPKRRTGLPKGGLFVEVSYAEAS